MAQLRISLSEELAALVKDRQRTGGYATPDAAAAALITHGLAADAAEDHAAGRSDDELRGLLDEAEESGAAAPWDAASARAEVLRRYLARTGG